MLITPNKSNQQKSVKKTRYSRPVILSLVLHACIIAFLCIHFAPKVLHLSSDTTAKNRRVDTTPVIQAQTFNQAQIEAEVNRLQAQKRAKEQAVIAKENKLKKALKTAQKQNQQKAVTIKKLQKDKVALARLKKQQKAQANALAQAKAKARAAKKAADKAKKEASTRQAALVKQQKARQKAEAKANALAKAQAESDAKIKAAEVAKQKAQSEAKAAAIAKAKAERDAKRAAEAIRLANQKRDAEKAASAARKAKHDAVVNRYALMIRNAIEHNWLYPKNTGKVKCLLALSLAPTGQVLDARLVHSSGDDTIDRLAIAAVYKSSPLPVPKNPNDFAPFRQINLTVWTHDGTG